MGNLLPPNLPLYLYRYRSLAPRRDDSEIIEPTIDREIAAIAEPYLWCAGFNKLNDPMEGFYRPSMALKNQSDYSKILRLIGDNKLAVGIASLSDTKENELMWTHYAGNYAGICIQYYSQRLLSSLPDNVDLVRMGYDDVPPRITSKDASEMEDAARKIFSQKKFNWAYEREWRVLGPAGKVKIRRKDIVRSIYLGSRITDEHKKRILRAFEKFRIRIYEMKVDGYARSSREKRCTRKLW